jgi:hypothetical protein
MENDIKIKDLEFTSTVKRMETNLEFSREANNNLKNDYDLL